MKLFIATGVIFSSILGSIALADVVVHTGDSCFTASQNRQVASAPALPTQAISGHIPRAVNAMSDLGKLDEARDLSFIVALKLNNESGLDAQITEMYRPGSPTFHHFLTPETFTQLYGPTAAQVQSETQYLEAQGITVQSVSENNVFIHAQASVADINRVFKTELHQYAQAKTGKVYFAPKAEPQIPVGSAIRAVIGLNSVARLEKHTVHRIVPKLRNDDGNPEGTAPGGGIAPADIIQSYQVPATATGAGETIALFELDGYLTTDIQAYESQFNLPATPLTNVMVDGATPDQQGDGADEVTLDIEMLIALAPNAKQIIVYEGPIADDSVGQAFETGYIDVMQKIATDNLAHEISTSWGTTEDNFDVASMQAESPIYKQMVAQGQTLFVASGDRGSQDDGSTLSVQNPASQPYVVSVGGTTLTLSSTNGWGSEVAWNSDSGAGGGGISSVFAIPSWQTAALSGDNQASTTMRNVPDVSLNSDADTGYGIYVGGSWQVIGGTSAAAPLWAAFNALVNQARTAKNLTPTGFLANSLYAVGEGSAYATTFHDITSGTNGPDGEPYSTFTGYDNATGWGSFIAAPLIQALATDPVPTVGQ